MQLNYKEFGQGDPLIILHGLFGMLDNWQTIAKRLATDHTVFIIDLRNHGRSPHTPVHTYPEMAEDLLRFMENHWIYKSHIMGHSMGGKTAMQFALDYPDRVDHLVVVDIAPKAYPPAHRQIINALRALDFSEIKNRLEADRQLAKTIDNPAIRMFLLKNLTRDKNGTYRLKMNLPVLDKYYDEITRAIRADHPFRGPALFLRGQHSPYIQDEDIPDIKSLFPNAVIETVTGAGHWIHADAPDEFLKKVKRFLH
ncbi:MAG TPA: alpha/beta fold hydrolase [Bacteroidetes bacterium]|nr:alpha/beta fold hydrolase [Bacteroidota bacterium]